MFRRGIGKVRGCLYTSPELTPSQRGHTFRQVCENFDLCGTGATLRWGVGEAARALLFQVNIGVY